MSHPMQAGMLELRVPNRRSWERFFQGDKISDDALASRWRRAVNFGVRADSKAFAEGVSDAALLERRAQNEALFFEGRTVLDPLASELASRGLLALVADAEGVILMARGGGSLEPTVTRTRLAEGMCWSERIRGTNAIGTALADKRAVAVVGAAHYEAMNHGLFCYAAPILDPYGEVRAVFDVTGSLAQDDAQLGVIVQTTATALSRVLRLQAYSSATGGYHALRKILARAKAPALLIEAPGVVGMVNEETARLLQKESAALEGLRCESLFAVDWRTLCQMAIGKGLVFEMGHAIFDVELEPIVGPSGRAFAVLAFLSLRKERAPRQSAHSRILPPSFSSIVGSDNAIIKAKTIAATLSVTELPVLLLAETGTGKELFAKAIHLASKQKDGPFVALNCGALSPTLLESELFGYAPGAFTGASRQGHLGKIASASGGTLFLDEVAEMAPSTQAMLLRVLEDGSFQRLGESRTSHSDFRLICATCRDLPSMVRAGTFRQDLFYRIQGACITLPAVRKRSDVIELAEALLVQLAEKSGVPTPALSSGAINELQRHSWPGNVRELKMALMHALALTPLGEEIEADCFPASLLETAEPASNQTPATASREDVMRDALERALHDANGNYAEAARRLGVARSTVYRMLKRMGRA
jgi:transcriptional regulator of acetoin/glycerol metabolism